MEIICRIVQQHPLRSQQYTDRRSGEQKTMNSIGFELASGPDTLYAESTATRARLATPSARRASTSTASPSSKSPLP